MNIWLLLWNKKEIGTVISLVTVPLWKIYHNKNPLKPNIFTLLMYLKILKKNGSNFPPPPKKKKIWIQYNYIFNKIFLFLHFSSYLVQQYNYVFNKIFLFLHFSSYLVQLFHKTFHFSSLFKLLGTVSTMRRWINYFWKNLIRLYEDEKGADKHKITPRCNQDAKCNFFNGWIKIYLQHIYNTMLSHNDFSNIYGRKNTTLYNVLDTCIISVWLYSISSHKNQNLTFIN